MTSPEHITSLAPNEVFVFGSNTEGRHLGGAAKFAVDKFGAVWGQARGLQGQSYAIPTVDFSRATYPMEDLRNDIRDFVTFANEHQELTFLVTAIGTGIAGMSADQVRS